LEYRGHYRASGWVWLNARVNGFGSEFHGCCWLGGKGRKKLTASDLDDLNEKVFVSKRHLQRTFQNKVGYGPKAYSRMLRFCEAIFYLQQNPSARMTTVAYDFGYADQSHFIREFKEFMGQNPRKFFADWPVETKVIIHKTFAYL